MNNLNASTESGANDSAIYNLFMSINILPEETNKTMSQLVKTFSATKDLLPKTAENAARLDQLKILENALQNDPSLANSIVGDRTSSPIGLNACTFTDPSGKINVAFGGTNRGEWIDNGEGLSGIPEENTHKTYDSNGNIVSQNVTEYASDQQVEALNWFNEVAAKNGWSQEDNIVITGHSKGGNKSQYITMNSDLVDTCYSFDGQGFSPEAIAQFKEQYGEQYEERINKMYTFAADNDYVNPLGVPLVPDDHIFYFEAPMGDENFAKYHYLESMLSEDGSFNTQCEQGDISKYLTRVSADIMALPPEERKPIVLSMMEMAQIFLGGNETVNGDSVSITDVVIGLLLSVDIALHELIFGYLENIGLKYGPDAMIEAYILTVVILSYFAPIIWAVIGIAAAISLINKIIRILNDFGNAVNQAILSMVNTLANNLQNWYNKNFNVGYRYAIDNTHIQLDTYKLCAYAGDLTRINRKICSLDSRLDSLYLKMDNPIDLISLIQADVFTGYSWRLNRCINYLNETGMEFERLESSLAAQING